VLLAACAAAPRFDGPLPVRNQHPAQLQVVHLPPAGATPVPAEQARFRLDAAYSSLYLVGNRNGNSITLDGEVLRSSLNCRYGLGGGLEAWLELPWALTTGGFLDSLLIDFHEAFGFRDGGRPQAPKDRFDVDVRQGGASVFAQEKERATLLDLPLGASWAFLPVTRERPFGLAVHAALELPVGNDDRGYGSGRIETAVGVSGELRAGPTAWSAWAQHAFAKTPPRARAAGFTFRDVSSVGGGVEVAVNDWLGAVAQLEYETSTLRDLNLRRASHSQSLLWTGLRARTSRRLTIDAALGEDLTSNIAPDFTVWVALSLRLGAALGPD
jgi:hypothetical protein